MSVQSIHLPIDRVRFAQAEARFVRNARKRGSLRRCKASFKHLVELFREDKLFNEIAKELNLSLETISNYYETYAHEFCTLESGNERARRILQERRSKREKQFADEGIWPTLVRKVADAALAEGCDVEPIFVRKERGSLEFVQTLIRINGELCYIHHLTRAVFPTPRHKSRVVFFKFIKGIDHGASYQVLFVDIENEKPRFFCVPSVDLDAAPVKNPTRPDRSLPIPIGPRHGLGKRPRFDFNRYRGIWPPLKKSVP